MEDSNNMPEKPQQPPTMYDMFSGMLKDHLGRSEFVEAFRNVVAQIQKLKLSNAQEIASMREHVNLITQRVEEKVQAKLATIQHGKDGRTPLKGIDYMDGEDGRDGEDGKTPTQEELLAIITPLIPKVKDGKDAEADIDAIVAQVLAKVPKGNGRVGWGAHPLLIKNSSGTAIDKVARIIKFGTNLTTTRSPDGVVTVSASGGSGSGYQAPLTGGLTGTNTWTTAPNIIVVDQGRAMQKTNTDGSANWTGTTTTVLTIKPIFDVYGAA